MESNEATLEKLILEWVTQTPQDTEEASITSTQNSIATGWMTKTPQTTKVTSPISSQKSQGLEWMIQTRQDKQGTSPISTDHNSEAKEDVVLRRRKRQSFSVIERSMIIALLDAKLYPSTHDLEELSEMMKLPTSKLRTFVQNERSRRKTKRKQRPPMDFNLFPPEFIQFLLRICGQGTKVETYPSRGNQMAISSRDPHPANNDHLMTHSGSFPTLQNSFAGNWTTVGTDAQCLPIKCETSHSDNTAPRDSYPASKASVTVRGSSQGTQTPYSAFHKSFTKKSPSAYSSAGYQLLAQTYSIPHQTSNSSRSSQIYTKGSSSAAQQGPYQTPVSWLTVQSSNAAQQKSYPSQYDQLPAPSSSALQYNVYPSAHMLLPTNSSRTTQHNTYPPSSSWLPSYSLSNTTEYAPTHLQYPYMPDALNGYGYGTDIHDTSRATSNYMPLSMAYGSNSYAAQTLYPSSYSGLPVTNIISNNTFNTPYPGFGGGYAMPSSKQADCLTSSDGVGCVDAAVNLSSVSAKKSGMKSGHFERAR